MAGGQQLLLIVVLVALLIAGGMFVLTQLGRIEARKFMMGASVALVIAATVVAVTALRSETANENLTPAARSLR